MKQFLLDTNIFLFYVRNELKLIDYIDKNFQPLTSPNRAFLSVVSEGELKAFALKNHWGSKKKQLLEELLKEVIIVDISDARVIDRYAEIDAYSQGKLENNPMPDLTSRNMGKNDLWIAATASVYSLILLTSDNDFPHLHPKFLELAYVDIKLIKAQL